LAITDADNNPSGFTVMVYSAVGGAGVTPGSSYGTLNGSLNPVNGGIYNYTAPSNLVLSPSTVYFVVLTAGTTVANGAYKWSVTDTASPGYTSDHWGGEIFFEDSDDGLHWNYSSGIYGQYALMATPVPEPGALGFLVLGALAVCWQMSRPNTY
jgi:hypothetical protein